MKVVMLAPWMKMGHGVSVMVACLEPELRRSGVTTVVGCLGRDKHFRGLEIREVRPKPEAVDEFVRGVGADVVVALGSPFFEVLPHLAADIRTIAFEAGDPTPELFADDAAERRRIVEDKRRDVYPHVDAVCCISDFIRHDIGWPRASVIRLGADNVPDLGPKPLSPGHPRGPLRVGALTRLGAGEAHYKGGPQILELKQQLDDLGLDTAFELMGRGTQEDAAHFTSRGFVVHLNAADAERNDFLRSVDVFVSTSLWEGTNLPLVEAQSLGRRAWRSTSGRTPNSRRWSLAAFATWHFRSGRTTKIATGC